MALVHVQSPYCQSIDVMKYGKQASGTQRYRCNNPACARRIFLLQYYDKGRLPAIKPQIVDMALNGSGVRDIVRILGVSSTAVIETLFYLGEPVLAYEHPDRVLPSMIVSSTCPMPSSMGVTPG